jgi:hypothetical protein
MTKIVVPLALAVLLSLVPSAGHAAPAPIELADSQSVVALLKARVGTPVTLMLRGGGEVGGSVVKVSGDAVHLGQLTGKDFYDAVVPFDAIAAVVVRVRQ